MKKVKAGILAVGVGIAAFAAGILTAPKSGKETRTDIKTGASKARVASEAELKKLEEELAKLIKIADAKTESLKTKSSVEKDKVVANAKKAKVKADEVIEAIKTKEVKDPDLSKAVEELKNAKDNLTKFLKN
ncbi:MAG: YtxH domain-containing protein [Patescibacteria group bacterium]